MFGGGVMFAQQLNGKTSFVSVAQPATAAADVLEKQVLSEIAALRSNPSVYAGYLNELRPFYAGREFRQPNQPAIVTNEGAAALDEAIAFLKTVKPTNSLNTVNGLQRAANDHLNDLLKNNLTGHRGSNNSLPDARIALYGTANAVKELIAYTAPTARQIVLNLLIDDGTATRGHRLALLKSDYNSIGISVGDSQKYGKICVIVMTDSFTAK